jgi:protoporphyrin/coproporphyrin ferrochelatase
MQMVRAATVGTHPKFVRMVRDLVMERLDGTRVKPALGVLGASHDVCPEDCCPAPPRTVTRPVSGTSA